MKTELPASLSVDRISAEPAAYLAEAGAVFAQFGPPSQDSGNVSYGVQIDGCRFFVKTTDPNAGVYLGYPERIALLRNAVDLNQRVDHLLLPELLNVMESAAGPMLVYQWVSGELLRARNGMRESAHERFRCLPVAEIVQALDALIDLHVRLAGAGYVAADFYDGCLIYDFDSRRLHVVDLDHYQQGPFRNEMGRMFGSSRFMAPEEYELGALIDERTTVFNLGRAAAIFLGDGTLERAHFRGGVLRHSVVVRACQARPSDRYAGVAEFRDAWLAAAD